jgi:threonine aldolase
MAIPIVKGFASDNASGVHPAVMAALQKVNAGHVIAYGWDDYTESAVAAFRRIFGEDIEVFFVYNGTGANVLALDAMTRPHHAVICADVSHINTDECGAPERFTGCKLVPVKTENGKMSPDEIRTHLHGFGFEHHSQPKVISITQCTEMGTVYRPAEIRKISDLARQYGMLLHMDGARIANAAAALKIGLKEMTRDVGVDVLSFGGTKNGVMFGEAVVFFNREPADGFCYLRKQGLQLASKMRYISAQFEALLENDLWLENARHANAMAQRLDAEVQKIPRVQILHPVEANLVFAEIPGDALPAIQQEVLFYLWGESGTKVRWVTTFDTTEEDVGHLVEVLKRHL